MKILGAILAGGQSRRFGSDKAVATWHGKALLDHVADALRPSCAQLIVVGRTWPGLETIADYPAPGLGPLGGLAGALAGAPKRQKKSRKCAMGAETGKRLELSDMGHLQFGVEGKG